MITETEHKAPEEVRRSQFGCRNCLWASIECHYGSMYQEEIETIRPDKRSKKTVQIKKCKAYSYYD